MTGAGEVMIRAGEVMIRAGEVMTGAGGVTIIIFKVHSITS